MARNDEEQRLIEKILHIEALLARPGSEGERVAAVQARDRIRARLRELEKVEKAEEFRFSMSDRWSKALFLALLQRYGLKAYRYPRQRRNTVHVKATPTFISTVLFPHFMRLDQLLHDHLSSVTRRIIEQSVHGDVEIDADDSGEP